MLCVPDQPRDKNYTSFSLRLKLLHSLFSGLLLSWESHHSYLFICSQSPVNQETMKVKLCQSTTLASEQESTEVV